MLYIVVSMFAEFPHYKGEYQMIQETGTTESGEVIASCELIKCPACNIKLPKKDLHAQIAHMEEHHPDVIAERLRDIDHWW